MSRQNSAKIPTPATSQKQRHKNTMKKEAKLRSFQAGRDHVAKAAKFHSPQAIKRGTQE